MQKKPGGKQMLKQIHVPEDSKLMIATQKVIREAAREQDDLKSFIMQSVEDASAPPTRSSFPSRPGGYDSGVKLRAGKGGKGQGKRGKNTDYIKDEFLPEDQREQTPASLLV